MLKINWDNHTNILCDIERTPERDFVKCSAEFKEGNVAHLLQIGYEFPFGDFKAKLTQVKYNSSNIKVYYEFTHIKEGF